ncbi:hypothetical protein BH23BAC4_BH23BAC4_16750 [soil metagenome]
MKGLILAAFVLAGLVAAPVMGQSLPGWASPSNPNSGPPEAANAPPPPPPPEQVPIDGGLGLLALAGAGYAVKRLRDNRKEA